MKNLGFILVGAFISLVLVSMTFFSVDERKYALVFRLGEIVRVEKEPGLHVRVPLFENVKLYEKRLLTFDGEEPAKINTSENKYMLVDYFFKWRIIDPVKFYVSNKEGGEAAAERKLLAVINDELKQQFGGRTVHEVITGERSNIMNNIRIKGDKEAKLFGVEVVDVRLKRVDYSDEISNSVYERMISERKRIAQQLRSEGASASEKIRADADKQKEVILAEAYKDAQQTKGDGDAVATEIYAQAYSKSPEFYDFYRSLEAYKNGFNNKNDIMVLNPSSEFFKYMRESKPVK